MICHHFDDIVAGSDVDQLLKNFLIFGHDGLVVATASLLVAHVQTHAHLLGHVSEAWRSRAVCGRSLSDCLHLFEQDFILSPDLGVALLF